MRARAAVPDGDRPACRVEMVLAIVAVVERDWVDYAQLGTGILGALVAAIALIIALMSAKHARKSADAAEASALASRDVARFAEQELTIVRQEAKEAAFEREKRPELRLSLSAEQHPLNDDGDVVILTATMHNDGARPAVGGGARIRIGYVAATIESDRTHYGSDRHHCPNTRPRRHGGLSTIRRVDVR